MYPTSDTKLYRRHPGRYMTQTVLKGQEGWGGDNVIFVDSTWVVFDASGSERKIACLNFQSLLCFPSTNQRQNKTN